MAEVQHMGRGFIDGLVLYFSALVCRQLLSSCIMYCSGVCSTLGGGHLAGPPLGDWNNALGSTAAHVHYVTGQGRSQVRPSKAPPCPAILL